MPQFGWRPLVRVCLWLIPLFFFSTKLVEWLSEAWFFEEAGQLDVYQRMMTARTLLFSGGALWCALWLWFNLRHARRVAAQAAQPSFSSLIPRRDRSLLNRHRRFWAGALLLLCIFFFGAYAAAHWLVALRLLAVPDGGPREAVFGLPVTFYLFHLPALNFAWTFLFTSFWLALFAVAVFYIYEDVWETSPRHRFIDPQALRHLTKLCALLFVWKALGYALSAVNLLTPRGAAWSGFDYTAREFRLAILPLLAAFSLIAAGALWRAGARHEVRRIQPIIFSWLGANLLFGNLAPLAVQRVFVTPRPEVEKPLLTARRRATQEAFALGDVRPWPRERVFQDAANNLPIWPPDLLQGRLQRRVGGNEFSVATPRFDVYKVGGALRPVFVAARERRDGKPGYGLIFCDAARLTPDGQPLVYEELQSPPSPVVYGANNLPANLLPLTEEEFNRTAPPVDVLRPQTRTARFAPYMVQPTNESGGVSLLSPKRLLLAWRYFDASLLQRRDAHLIWHRGATERCMQLAPFFFYDEPHPVLSDSGRTVWLVNALTLADSYPLAFPLSNSRLNYLRAGAVATVDAHSGQVDFYAVDESDALLQSYRRLFPTLFKPLERMPPDLQSHWAPSPLQFSAQCDVWARALAPAAKNNTPLRRVQIAARPPTRGATSLGLQSFAANGSLFLGQLFSENPESSSEKSLFTAAPGDFLIAERRSGAVQLWHWHSDAPTNPRSAAPPWRFTFAALPLRGDLLLQMNDWSELNDKPAPQRQWIYRSDYSLFFPPVSDTMSTKRGTPFAIQPLEP